MIGAERYRKNKVIPTINFVTCPACKKDRLGKYINEDGSVDTPSEETVEVREEARFLEVCGLCVERYRRADEKFVMENMRKLAKAFQEETPEDGESDHKDFSLN